MKIETMSIHLRSVSLKVGIYFVLYLVASTMPTTTLTRSSFTGFQGAMSFSYNFRPLTIMTKRFTARTTTRAPILVGQNGRHGSAARKKQSLLMVLGGPPMDDSLGKVGSRYSRLGKSYQFESALAIVPPSEDWDRLQRARHFARDPVFREWPPAIRLFHPFDNSPNIAFDIAQLVEDLEIEAFEIKLDSWVIVPDLEATQIEWEKQEVLPEVEETGTLESYFQKLDRAADEEVKELIESEERKGRIKAVKKNNGRNNARQKQKEVGQHASGTMARGKKSPQERRDEQRKSMEEDFGGPSVLCLEPDEESKEKLSEIRELLREGLGLPSYSSPSSVYSWEFVDIDMGYRPLIPISKFHSFTTAMDTASRLKGLWGDPLTINVKSLEIISCKTPDDTSFNEDDDGDDKTFHFSSVDRFSQENNQYAMNKNTWGCNAKVMLVGEEIQQNDAANEKMIEQLLENGEIGGADISMDFTILEDEEESTTDIMQWLDEDDDFDEGSQVIIGRTHFFNGDQRNYNGMPATSAVDAKDRALGEVGSVSGVARRRGAISRTSGVWKEGEFGRRTKDHLPWGLRDRTGKDKLNEKYEKGE